MNLRDKKIEAWPAAAREFLATWLDDSDSIEVMTSGSTGEPKPVRLLKEDMRRSAEATVELFCIGSDSILACPLSMDYIAAKMMVVRSVISGASLWFEHPSAHPLRDFDGPQIDLLAIVPYQAEGLAERLLDAERPLNVRQVIVGGAPLSPVQQQILEELPAHVYATYGMTETASHVALRDISAADAHFQALPGYSFATDERGCLVISHPERSWRSIVTNDLVELTSPQQFSLRGRADNIINSGGIKVIPEVVEERIRHCWPEIDCYVTSRPHPTLGSEVVMVVDVNSELPVDVNIEAIKHRLAPMLPSHFWAPRDIVRREICRTERGKLIREKL